LTESTPAEDFKRNPQQFIDQLAADAINRCKRLALVDGIKYQRLGDEHYYAQEMFESEELSGYLQNLVLNTEKSVYEHVVYDSAVERDFAESLEKNEAVKVYAKLPGWFKVPTPLGTYNPDWAVLVSAQWPGTAVFRRRNEEQLVRRRSARPGEWRDQMRRSPLRGARSRGEPSAL
jgi:type III restriction enzyme